MLNKMNYLLSIISAILLLGLFAQFTVKYSTEKTEVAQYKIIKKYKNFEVREYPQLVLASTKMNSATYKGNANKGFRAIAGYIFGGNEGDNKIAMTSPVVAHMSDSMKMSFIMPDKYALEDLPIPDNKNVILEKREAKKLAVITFGGYANDIDIENHTRWLKKYLDKENIAYTDNVYFHGYNPPYELFGRRNEVAIELQ